MTIREQTISRAAARRVYNRLGRRIERAARFESRAKAVALARLDLAPGQQVLQIGVGAGAEHQIIADAVAPGGAAVGLDLSRGMLALTRRRVATPLVEGDAIRLPFAAGRFDRLVCAYVLDLLPAADLPATLAECVRVVRPGGRLALVSLTAGVDAASRLFVASWMLGVRIDPERFGGCRPLQLGRLLADAGVHAERRVVVQRGFPSEVLVIERGPDA